VVLGVLVSPAAYGQQHWVASWASSQQVPEPANALAATDLTDATMREIVHLSLGGGAVRVRLSNAFGTAALHLRGVHLARVRSARDSAIDAATDRALLFGGAQEVTIPPGVDYWSDAVAMPVTVGSDLAVTISLDVAPEQQTAHPGSRATSYLLHGSHVADGSFDGARKMDHWFFLSGVDVASTGAAGGVVALGDSITDGHGATTNGNDRWPDDLAARLNQEMPGRVAVVNEGIGGNHMLTDGLGPNALARFDRDVLAQSGVRTLIVLEGVNDLGALARRLPVGTEAEYHALVATLEGSYAQVIERAHAHGIFVVGGTILPYAGSDYYHPTDADEAARQELNRWIRQSGHFDGVVDFDQAMRDPAAPTHLLAAYDSGDHLHPSVAGYKAMAAAIPLALLLR
jgi:lysophospholipase L1-like esterase